MMNNNTLTCFAFAQHGSLSWHIQNVSTADTSAQGTTLYTGLLAKQHTKQSVPSDQTKKASACKNSINIAFFLHYHMFFAI